MLILYKNDAGSKLAAGITAVQTTLSLTAGHGAKFPQPVAAQSAFWVTVEAAAAKERMLCTARAGDVLTVTRGQGGTTAAAFLVGALVELRANAELMDSKIGLLPAEVNLFVYVSTTGNDTTGNGTAAAPYATVAKALAVLENKTTVRGYFTISVADGEYDTPTPLSLVTPAGARLSLRPTTNAAGQGTASLDIAGTVRANSTAYTAGQFIIPATPTGFWYECTTAGTSGAAPPTFGTALNGTTADGAALVWTCRNYHDVSMSLSGGGGLIVNRFLRCDYASLNGCHQILLLTGSTCKFRVYDRGARVVEATGALVANLIPLNVVFFTTVGNSLVESYYGGELADVGFGFVLDGRSPAFGSIGLALWYWHHVPSFGAAIVNCNIGVEATDCTNVYVGGSVSNCNTGALASRNAFVFADRMTGCGIAGDIKRGAMFQLNTITGCATGVINTMFGNSEVTDIKNIAGTAQSLANGSKAKVGTIANANLGVSIIGGSYAEVTTFTGNTTNSDLAVNTVGNANSYVKN